MNNLDSTTLTSSLTPFAVMVVAFAVGTYALTIGTLRWYAKYGKRTSNATKQKSKSKKATISPGKKEPDQDDKGTRQQKRRAVLWKRRPTSADPDTTV
jgi:hypothetical protein